MARSVEEWIGKTDDERAPPRRECSVDGCGRKHDSHGYCVKHAHRFRRHGNPLGGQTDKHAAANFMADIVLSYQGDNCLAWKFGNNGKGYGVFHVDRKAVAAHVYVCTTLNGPRPSANHDAAHSCGNGHLGCVNPKHLRWATRSENQRDRHKHGTMLVGTENPRAKLTDDDVRKIRSLIGVMSQRQIAKKFGVSQMIVSRIHRGQLWGHVDG